MNKSLIFVKSHFLKVTIFVASSILVSTFFMVSFSQNDSIDQDVIRKAVIIDQLYDDFPNVDYQQTVIDYLYKAGYKVDLYTTKDITVDFYKELPSMNYEFIVIRSHALEDLPKLSSGAIFTGEEYTYERHTGDQLSGHLWKGVPYPSAHVNEVGWENLEDETYFLIGSKFVDDKMKGQFPNSVIILGGCDTTTNKLLTKSLLARGASTVVGWNGLIRYDHNDEIILEFLKEVLLDKIEIKFAVKSVMEKDFGSFDKSTQLEYFSNMHVKTDMI